MVISPKTAGQHSSCPLLYLQKGGNSMINFAIIHKMLYAVIAVTVVMIHKIRKECE